MQIDLFSTVIGLALSPPWPRSPCATDLTYDNSPGTFLVARTRGGTIPVRRVLYLFLLSSIAIMDFL